MSTQPDMTLEELETEVAEKNVDNIWEAYERACAERDRALCTLQYHEDREAFFAKALGVADGGKYREDWPGAIRRLIKERDDALERIERLEWLSRQGL